MHGSVARLPLPLHEGFGSIHREYHPPKKLQGQLAQHDSLPQETKVTERILVESCIPLFISARVVHLWLSIAIHLL